MRVLVACEFSGVVRDAFRAVGSDAWSCDLLPTETPGPHLQCDVRHSLSAFSWDMMIAHPPCTHLAVSGARWWGSKQTEQVEAIEHPRLDHLRRLAEPRTQDPNGREQRIHRMPPSPDRWKLRSVTYRGIAAAMASQWGSVTWHDQIEIGGVA